MAQTKPEPPDLLSFPSSLPPGSHFPPINLSCGIMLAGVISRMSCHYAAPTTVAMLAMWSSVTTGQGGFNHCHSCCTWHLDFCHCSCRLLPPMAGEHKHFNHVSYCCHKTQGLPHVNCCHSGAHRPSQHGLPSVMWVKPHSSNLIWTGPWPTQFHFSCYQTAKIFVIHMLKTISINGW